jgi:hypothetical protein
MKTGDKHKDQGDHSQPKQYKQRQHLENENELKQQYQQKQRTEYRQQLNRQDKQKKAIKPQLDAVTKRVYDSGLQTHQVGV